jgi:hypothetical protein
MHISKNFTWLEHRRWDSKTAISEGVFSERPLGNHWSVMMYDDDKRHSTVWKYRKDGSYKYRGSIF